jgi:hypothetical protein
MAGESEHSGPKGPEKPGWFIRAAKIAKRPGKARVNLPQRPGKGPEKLGGPGFLRRFRPKGPVSGLPAPGFLYLLPKCALGFCKFRGGIFRVAMVIRRMQF